MQLANAHAQVWARQYDARDVFGEEESARRMIQAMDDAILYRNALEDAARPGTADEYRFVMLPPLLMLEENERAFAKSRTILTHVSAIRALGDIDSVSDEAVGAAGPILGWMAARDETQMGQAIAFLSRARADLIDGKIGRAWRSDGVSAMAAEALNRTRSLRSQIRAQRGAGVSGELRDAYFRAYERLSALLAPDASDQRLARIMQATGAEAIALTTFGATAPAGSTIVYARARNGALQRASAVKVAGTRDDPVRRLLFGGDLPRREHMSRINPALRAGRGQQSGGWIGALSPERRARPDGVLHLRQAVSTIGAGAWEAFGGDLAAQLARAGVRDGARVLWIASGSVSFLPVGLAVDPASGRRLIDRFEIMTSPSIDFVERGLRVDAAAQNASGGGVFDPTGDLRFATVEAAFLRSFSPMTDLTQGDGAPLGPAPLLNRLGQYRIWHFAAHGAFDWREPSRSGVLLRTGARANDQARLTLRDVVAQTNLAPPRLVVLSACETGLVGLNDNPDAFIGLPAAFLAVGARGVVATLWPVNDVATAFLMGRFYQLVHREGAAPPTALRQAQLWLRDATQEELQQFLSANGAGLSETDLATAEDELIADSDDPRRRP